ncbi:hypothetical protein COLO4_16133 [Corchorus olitorius]|uniref:Uncharacterized protein n=1 Tax=Corchorus olitorius TaxID=93759 RepID=A0A1R3JJC2_9ROSI|nr:hypothetical protein COLO4_16133 [Corchorus olitorius]
MKDSAGNRAAVNAAALEVRRSPVSAQNTFANSPRRPESKSGFNFVESSPQLPRSSFYRTGISLPDLEF